MERGPLVASLSAAQLRVIARIRSSRPNAEFHWTSDAAGWRLEVVEATHRGRPPKQVVLLHLTPDGAVHGAGALL